MSTANPVAVLLGVPSKRLYAALPCIHGIIQGVPENRLIPGARHSCDEFRPLLDHVQVFDTGYGRASRILVSSLYRDVDTELLAKAETRFALVSVVSAQSHGHSTLLLARADSAVALRLDLAAR